VYPRRHCASSNANALGSWFGAFSGVASTCSGWRDNARMCLELFPFRFRDPRTGKWVRSC
jgi:hypothetical protein